VFSRICDWLRAFVPAPGVAAAVVITLGPAGSVLTTAAADREAPEFFLRTWHTEDGLPQNHGTAIVQTREGYLWVGTYNGLARFDGARFVAFNAANTPGLKSSRVTSLYEDKDGVLWVGHDTGELTALREGRFAPVPLPLPGRVMAGGIAAMDADAAGDLWLLHENGLAVRARDGATADPEPGVTVPSLVRSRSGTLWRVHGGKLLSVGARAPAPTSNPAGHDFIVRACASREGGLWLAGGERVRRWHADGREQVWGQVPWGKAFVTAMLESADGSIWVGTLDQGLFVLSAPSASTGRAAGGYLRFTRTNGLAHDWVRSLGQDREGTVWIGTSGGVCAARERRVRMIAAPDAWKGRTVLTVSPGAGDSVWMGTEGAGLYRMSQGQWTRFGESEGLTNLFVWSVLEDSRGRVWAGTWGGGLFRLEGKRFVHPPMLAGENVPVCALLATQEGALWAGTQRGLWRVTDAGVERFGDGLVRPDVRAIAEARDGTVWFGMSGGGLGRWRDGQIVQYRQSDGLPSDYVWSLRADEDGTLWIGTFGGGLGRLRDGRFAVIGERQGLPNNVICHIADDGQGRLWLGSYGGLLRAPKDAIHRCADGQIKEVGFFAYGKADGLESVECSGGLQPGGCRMADGQLWFPTSKGAAVVNPAEMKESLLGPPVVIENILVDGVEVSPSRSGSGSKLRAMPPPHAAPAIEVRVQPGQQRLEVHFAALSFVAPERIRFRYRLRELEEDWVEGGSKRMANYSFVPPGAYLFQVLACDSDGAWNGTEATLAVVVLPHYWQTWWFRVLAGLGAAGALGGVVRTITRRRYRRKLERLERQRAIEKERARIAKDIHDDLGASLTRITLLSQSVREDLDDREQAVADLDRIYDTARELTRAMDEIVWAVNPHHDTLDSLITYLGGFAHDFLSAAGVRCRLEVPLRPPPWPVTAEIRHNLFLAFKEAVHNVARHASATEVMVRFHLETPGFTLSIEDNGLGFDPTQPNGLRPNGTSHLSSSSSTDPVELGDPAGPAVRLASGNGLVNMHRRLEEIGGRCVVESVVGSGTTVRFVVLSSAIAPP
jgi:ligand-binding sensor domain-containing protein/signal transduction histidine kinase